MRDWPSQSKNFPDPREEHLGICVHKATSFAGFTYPFLTLPAHLRSSPVTPVSFPFHHPPGVPQLD